ncbi:Yip1 family protein [Hazenella coriacea]|uniref:Yip1-like protein n=1 Tax=Hazenella coriacea TaxID=1179467 RepID=A0A4R3L5F2_9BACL|nr:Yip1 family protein [Hazenella coriacea]TCS94248.1 Yip1-like protein [Hazenella coriacea]
METTQQPALDKGRKPSVFGILTSPREQFQRINQNPTFWGPLIIFTVLVTLIVVAQAYLLINDPSFIQQSMEPTNGQPSVDPEILKMITFTTSVITGLFMVPVVSLVSAFFCWLMVTIFQGETTFKKMFSLNVHLMILSVISLIMALAYSVITGDVMGGVSPTSLATIISSDGALKGILSSIDVIRIWSVVLTAIGLSVVGELSKGKAWTISLIFFVIGMMFSVIGSYFSAMNM